MTADPFKAVEAALREVAEHQQKNELVVEDLQRRLIEMESVGWTALAGAADDTSGPTLTALHTMVDDLQDMAVTNPLHIRGAQLRHSYVFGRGVQFSDLTPKTEALLEDPYIKESLFSVEAYETNNLAQFTDGNLFVIRDEKTNQITRVPIKQITAVATDEDDNSKIQYLLRRWNANGEDRQMWYPLARYKKTLVGRGKRGPGIRKTIDATGLTRLSGMVPVPVSQDKVIYHKASKRQVGWTFGVPDSLAAKVWTLAYSEYEKDNLLLVKALSQLAWKVTTSTKSGANDASVQLANANAGVGQTAVMGANNALQSVGTPGSNVNFNNGQPIAAMVATSFGVPVIALLSSPGATGGSYGAATTLDLPTLKGMKALQDAWVTFYTEILQDMGSPEVKVSFPSIESDPTYREVASIALAYEASLLHQDEAREGVLEVLDVPIKHANPPKKEPKTTNGGSVASQGNSGAVTGGQNQGDTNHDGDED